jgi:hypothetical protein
LKGHGFSRAAKAASNRGFSPCAINLAGEGALTQPRLADFVRRRTTVFGSGQVGVLMILKMRHDSTQFIEFAAILDLAS